MPPTAQIKLPAGSRIGVSFKKGTPPVVFKVHDDSDLKGKVKPGYVVESMSFEDGTIYNDLSSKELIQLLQESVYDEGRKLKFRMKLPLELEVTLPKGDTGLSVETRLNGQPVITYVNPSCELAKEVRVGMVVQYVILQDGTKVTGASADEINQLLDDDCESDKRKIYLTTKIQSVELIKSMQLPRIKRVDLPTGLLGVSFRGNKIAHISKLKSDSPMRGLLRIGMVCDTIQLGDKTQFRGLDPVSLSELVQNTSDEVGRFMILKSPKSPPHELPRRPTISVPLPNLGGAADLGLVFAGTPAIIKAVAPNSPLSHTIRPGQKVVSMYIVDGMEYDEIDHMYLVQLLHETSGEKGRYLVLDHSTSGPVQRNALSVYLPPGKIGVGFKGTPPCVTKVLSYSPLLGRVQVGMLADTLSVANGQAVHYEMSSRELLNTLKEYRDTYTRRLRFIHPVMDLTPPPTKALPDEMTVVLPAGKLGLGLKGHFPCVVVEIRSDSPVRREIPVGMAFDSLTVGKDVYKHMAATEAAAYLKGTESKEGRILKLKNPNAPGVSFSKNPNSKQIVLPTGSLGVVFKGSPPIASRTAKSSALAGVMPVGMFVDMLTLSDGTVMTGLTYKDLVKTLSETSNDPERIMLLKNPKTKSPTPGGLILPDDKTLVLPTGSLGISFKGKFQAKVSRLHDGSSMAGKIPIGMVVDSIILPNGQNFAGVTAKEARLVLTETKSLEGRKLVLKNPITVEMTARNVLTDDADGSIMSASISSSENSFRL